MITADILSRHEFIGLDTKVINSSNSEVVGFMEQSLMKQNRCLQ